MNDRPDRLVERLSGAVGNRHVLSDPADLGPFTTDWAGRFGLTTELDQVERAILECVAASGGDVADEHGLERAKVEFLDLPNPRGQRNVMPVIKMALDPGGILNPGAVFDQVALSAESGSIG